MKQPRSHKADKVLERMAKKPNRWWFTACVHCGLCTDSCYYVLTNRTT
jgi:heterodisulfide reductase subunit C